MEIAIRQMAALALIFLGASHVLRARAWVRFFRLLQAQGDAGVFATAFLHFWPGLLIVSFHDVWSGIPIVLTIYGWLLVIKGGLYFLMPSIGLASLNLLDEERPQRFAFVGFPMIAIGVLLGWDVLTAKL